MVLVKVPEGREDEMLVSFCQNSAFTFEGLDITDKKGLKKLEEYLRETGFKKKDMLGFHFKGSVMNSIYGLTESNAYPDDLTFLVIPDYYNPIVKLQLGARWFDDIVANNQIRQNAINSGIEPDYGGDIKLVKEEV